MTESEVKARSSDSSAYSGGPEVSAIEPYTTRGNLEPQACSSCGTEVNQRETQVSAPANYVYSVGKIEFRFPRISIEKELIQATGRTETSGLTDRQAIQGVLSQPQNRYLARQLSWVLTIEGLETYILFPHDPADLDLLIAALRPTPGPGDLDCIIGTRRRLATPEMCNGLIVPIVVFDQIYSFDRDALIKAIPVPEKMSAKTFAPAAAELFDRIMQIADNAGATDEHRALNYLAVRYQTIYAVAAEAFARNESLTAVDIVPSRLSGIRTIFDVVFSFTHRATGFTQKFFVRVDVTDEFPFLVTKMAPYHDR